MRPERSARDFVQIGATRDGLDRYVGCARKRGMRAVLVDTPAFLNWRREMGRCQFDVELAVDRPADVELVRGMLRDAEVDPNLVLAGSDIYVESSFGLAAALGVAPWPRAGVAFRPRGKHGNRTALAEVAPHLPQPRFRLLDDRRPTTTEIGLEYPLVIKPVDAAGGFAVFLVRDDGQHKLAQQQFEILSHLRGGPMGASLAEEFVSGEEISVQGVAYQGRPFLLSITEKIVSIEERPWGPGLLGFRDVAYILRHGAHAGTELVELANYCLQASGYQEGPFHVDAVRTAAGAVFLEMGFRLSSGRIVALVEMATGADWPELTFQVHLDQEPPQLPDARDRGGVVAQIMVTSESELGAGSALGRDGAIVEVQRASPSERGERFTPDDLRSLAGDRMLVSRVAGRVIINGDRLDEVRSLIAPLVSRGSQP